MIAFVVTDLERGWFGQAARLDDELGGRSVLALTVARLAGVKSVEKIVLVHPVGQEPMGLLGDLHIDVDVDCFDHETKEGRAQRYLVSARKWAMTSWRGGLGWASSYDEILPAAPLVKAMESVGAESGLFVRGDWPLFDVGYAEGMIKAHEVSPEAMRFCFTQSPVGLSGCVLTYGVLSQLAEGGSSLGNVLGYNSRQPMLDPISRDVNFAIAANVRDCKYRFAYDTPRSVKMLREIADEVGGFDELVKADAERVTEIARQVMSNHALHGYGMLPQQLNVELTAERGVSGEIVPQQHVDLNRGAMDKQTAMRLIDEIDRDKAQDVSVIFGGLGDAMLYEDVFEVIEAAVNAKGVMGVAVETDLLGEDQDVLLRLLESGVDLILVRINADTPEVYERVMGVDRFKHVMKNMEYLFNQRGQMMQRKGIERLPWIVPRFAKCVENLADMEMFFERWMQYAQHAVIDPAPCGCGRMKDLSPVPMEPPHREGCKQLGLRMSVLSDGRVARCDQDWLGDGAMGQVGEEGLLEIWKKQGEVKAAHEEEKFTALTLCGDCTEWFRP